MALAEARAALHRTANRCLVQEDAKRAPKLACCSSVPTSVKPVDTVSTASGGQDVPGAVSKPFNLSPSFSHLPPNSKWWLYLQPNHGYQKGSMDEQFSSMEISPKHETSGDLARNEDNPGLIDQTSCNKLTCRGNMESSDKLEFGVKEDRLSPFSPWNCQDTLRLEVKQKVEVAGSEVPKSANEPCFDPGSSLIGDEKNVPWWRTADTDELASLVAQRSLDYIENCDLPRPQNTRMKKDVDANICCFGHDGIPNCHYSSRLVAAGNPTSGSVCQNHSVVAEGQSDNPLRDETMAEMHIFDKDASKAQLMEALCHSQTRAREAERAAKQACAEKEHVVKLVFRQASQLFAYKQWLQLLQLESIYLQFLNNSSESLVFQRTKETQTTRHTMSSTRKPTKQCHPQYEAVVFAIGLGLAGAGFLLGWTIAQMFPRIGKSMAGEESGVTSN